MSETSHGIHGISDLKLKHSLGVARKAYAIAKERGHDEGYARKMFVIGLLHDAGYEFSATGKGHAEISGEVLSMLAEEETVKTDPVLRNAVNAIATHGNPDAEQTEEWLILNAADMQVNGYGQDVGYELRLKDITDRYGPDSEEARKSARVVSIVKEHNISR